MFPELPASEFANGCWRSESSYEGSGVDADRGVSDVAVFVTLDAGASQFFSGVRLLMCCQGGERFKDLVIREIDLISANPVDERPQQRTEIKSNDGHERETPWPVLPLCTVVYEFVDAGDEVWVDTKMVLRAPDERAENLQILHEVVEFGPPSGTLVRCFKISPSLFSWSTIQCHRRRQIGVYTRAVRILPPAPFRAPSINLPAEILRLIFEEAVSIDQSMFGHWRLALLSFSLVCRSWTIARECLFREFGDHVLESSRPDPTAVAHALQLNPVLGRAIRRFGFDHFCCQRDLTFDIAMIGILKTATFMRHLNAYDTHPMLGKQFVEAICVSREMRVFTNHRGPLKPGEERYLMSAADLEKCVSHWPLLHTLEIHAFSSLRDEDQETDQQPIDEATRSSSALCEELENPSTPSTCQIQNLRLENGHITGPQLLRMTAYSHSSLHTVFFQDLTGFTNTSLRTWLAAIGPALTDWTLKRTPVHGRAQDEEYAIDAMMPIMVNLRKLDVEGDVVSELAVMRREYNWAATGIKGPNRWGYLDSLSITVENAPGVRPHGIVSALGRTDWSQVCVHQLFSDDDGELKAEADMIARERGILFWSPKY